MAKNNLLERGQRCSLYTSVFYGYALGMLTGGSNLSLRALAQDWITKNNLEDVTRAEVLQVNYYNFYGMTKELKSMFKDQDQ